MNPLSQFPFEPAAASEPTGAVQLPISRSDRWLIYYRLQELDIPCYCNPQGQLWVSVETPGMAVQVWSVMRSLMASRSSLVNWLERCWD